MAMSKIPVLKPVTTGYSDAWHAIRAMPMLAGYAFLIMLAVSLLEYVLPTQSPDMGLGATLISIAVNAAQNFLITPIMIAVHRFIILEEVTPSYALAPGSRMFGVFFLWLTALSTLGLLSILLFAPGEGPSMFSTGFVAVAMVALVVISVRLSILFPAIAVAAPGATASNAWADSKRNTLRIFIIFLLAVLPLAIGMVVVLAPFVVTDAGATDAPPGIPGMIGLALVQAFVLVLYVAIASRLYQALADRLLGHAAPGQGA